MPSMFSHLLHLRKIFRKINRPSCLCPARGYEVPGRLGGASLGRCARGIKAPQSHASEFSGSTPGRLRFGAGRRVTHTSPSPSPWSLFPGLLHQKHIGDVDLVSEALREDGQAAGAFDEVAHLEEADLVAGPHEDVHAVALLGGSQSEALIELERGFRRIRS